MSLKSLLGLKRKRPREVPTSVRTWPNAAARLREGRAMPHFTPSFQLTPGATVFTIGSCFARNVEEHLARRGIRVPMLDFSVPDRERSGQRVTGILNKYTVPVFRQELEWVAGIHERDGKVRDSDCLPLALASPGGEYVDLHLGGFVPVTWERFRERRSQVYSLFASAFRAECMIATPGLIEAWRDRETGLYIHAAPYQKGRLLDASRFEFELLSYAECFDHLRGAIEAVRRLNPTCKVVLTVSPVPLERTFSEHDILIANHYGKSMLRTVCGAISMELEQVDYFPSLEAVTAAGRRAWRDDLRHVTDEFVDEIVAAMLRAYVPAGSAAAPA